MAVDLLELAPYFEDALRARDDPTFLLKHVKCVDPETQDEFQFHLHDPDSGWYWQREILDMWRDEPKSVCLKARQLGITWLAGAYALWHLLYKPGSRVLIFSTKQTEAVKVIGRIWDMLNSLPKVLWNNASVYKPSKGARPQDEIVMTHPGGRVSSIIAFTSSPAAGHGETAALVILDEFSRQEYARDTWKAVLPTAAKGGRILIISTGNGVSSMQGEEAVGNFFHHLWSNADTYGITKRFLRWDLHPDRDEKWYGANAMALPPAERGEQYPRDEQEAFILTGSPFFDRDSLRWYAENGQRTELLRGQFETTATRKAAFVRDKFGWISVYEKPVEDRDYAIAADTASGKGLDYSAACVIDLETMAIVAEFHGKIAPDLYAEQLHYLGRWYNTAWIAPETAGGWSEPVIIGLKDGRTGRPPYPLSQLYRHRLIDRVEQPQQATYGFPMTTKTRPQVIGQLQRAIREHSFPYLSAGTLAELGTFVHRKTTPSPAAQDGANDDRVMALAIACELYRQRGHWPEYSRPEAIRSPQKRPLGRAA